MTTRTLDIIPIVHAEADLGGMADTARAATGAAWAMKQRVVEDFWRTIERWAESLHVVPGRIQVYQDGLPVCGKEERIVADVARQGSRNHKVLERLVRRGAVLHGTEHPELLLEEYEFVRRSLASAATAPSGTAAADLLARRDAFIAGRIDETLPEGGAGILFIGLLHDVEGHLPADVVVRHPVGRPHAGGSADRSRSESVDAPSAEESRT